MCRNIFCILMIVLAAASCKKKETAAQEEDWDSGPLCPVSNSLIELEDYQDSAGYHALTEYSYDALNRLVKTINRIGGDSSTLTYQGMDSVWYDYRASSPSRILRTFSSDGEHLTTTVYGWFTPGDTALQQWFYGFSADHRLRTVDYFGIQKHGQSDTTQIGKAEVLWDANNVTEIRLLDTAQALRYLPARYTYQAGTNGFFIYNSPDNSSGHLYTTVIPPVLSANLLATSVTNGGAEIRYEYTFDDAGRVKTMNTSDGRQRKFRYRCH